MGNEIDFVSITRRIWREARLGGRGREESSILEHTMFSANKLFK